MQHSSYRCSCSAQIIRVSQLKRRPCEQTPRSDEVEKSIAPRVISPLLRAAPAGSLFSGMSSWRQRFPVHLLAFGILLVSLSSQVRGQSGRGRIGLNDTVSGTTIGADAGGYTSFNTEDIGGAGQVFYVGNVTEGEWDVTFSTCAAASFDTYLVIFSGTAFVADNVLGEANNDPTCAEDFKRSKTTVRLRSGPYIVLVTGVGIAQGTFTLQSSALLPQTSLVVPWGLDRIDQRHLPLDGKYNVPEMGTNGAGITVYVLDSGVRKSHDEFEGRVTDGFDFVGHTTAVKDCSGLGTSAAGVIAGKTYGVAKEAKIVSVRVIDCDNKAQINHITSALEWVILNVQFQPSRQVPAVVFLRFHSGANEEVDKAVTSVTKFGIPVIAPAGDDDNGEYCTLTSPATSGSAIMVASTDEDDFKSVKSNYGSCTSLFAPGNNVTAASFTSDTAVEPASGSAIAAAHVAGAIALLLDMNSGASPRDLGSILSSLGTVDVVKNGTGRVVSEEENDDADTSPPRLTFVRSIPSLFGDRSAGEIPREKTIFLYFMVKFTDIQATATDACGAATLKPKMETVLETAEADLFALCSNDTAVYRVNTGEREAASASSKVSLAIGGSREDSIKTLGSNFEVVEEPWFVDAQGFVYWSEPQFQKADKSALTVGAIVGIAVGAVLVVIVLGVFGYAGVRHSRGVDDIESMEGSADFERGPTHFNDFAHHDGPRESSASQVARSFRNVVQGIGRSLSLRGDGGGLSRTGSRRGGDEDGGGGISRMDSYMGQVRGADQGGGTDIMRMKSYGGEAFAGLGAVSRSNSMRSMDGSAGKGGETPSRFNGDQRVASFRGAGALFGLTNTRQKSEFGFDPADAGGGGDGPRSMSNIRMHSMGGEAFAALTRELSAVGKRESYRAGARSRGAQSPSGVAQNDKSSAQESCGPEELAPSGEEEVGREPSFFNSGGALR